MSFPKVAFKDVTFEDVKGKVFKCTKHLEDYTETELDENMKGKIAYILQSSTPDVMLLGFDTTGFDEHNDFYAKANYYDKNGVPCLTAKQAGDWPADGIVEIYLDESDLFSDFFVEV